MVSTRKASVFSARLRCVFHITGELTHSFRASELPTRVILHFAVLRFPVGMLDFELLRRFHALDSHQKRALVNRYAKTMPV